MGDAGWQLEWGPQGSETHGRAVLKLMGFVKLPCHQYLVMWLPACHTLYIRNYVACHG
jgi:hypothetical protein